MKVFVMVLCSICLAASVAAQDKVSVEQLQEQMKLMKEQFESTMEQQRKQMESLQKQLELLQKAKGAEAAKPNEKNNLDSASGVSSGIAASGDMIETQKKSWSPSDPIPIFNRGGSFLDLSLNGLFSAGTTTASDVEALQPGGHDPNQRGFTLQNLEATFSGMVDRYFRGQAALIFQIDPDGESNLEVEEAYLETISLPGNLQVRGGQFFTEFGRLNATHPHTWDFVDQPLVNGRFLGPDGLRNPGARVSWLVPTPFFSELFFTIQNSQGETAHSFRSGHEDELFLGRFHESGRVKSPGDMLFATRYAASFDLTPTQTILAGASAAIGPNSSGPGEDTQIYGVDLFWKWRPANQSGGFPFVSWQTEAMVRRYEAGDFSEDLDGNGVLDSGEPDLDLNTLPTTASHETLEDFGFYSQVAYGFKKGWVTALRGDYVTDLGLGNYERIFGRDQDRARRWRISPNLTWYPSEFSKLRLQYNYDDRELFGVDHSVWLQFEFLLGKHGAHKF